MQPQQHAHPPTPTKNEWQETAQQTQQAKLLTLDGLHGVLDLEEAALGGPDGHVRVVLVAEHNG